MPGSRERKSSKADAGEDKEEDSTVQGDKARLDSKPASLALAEEEENAVEEDAKADEDYGLPRDESRADDNRIEDDAESQQDDDDQDLQAEGGEDEMQSRASDDNDADLGEGQEEEKDIYEQEAEAILARQSDPKKVIPHPMHTKVKEVDDLVDYLQKLVDEERYLDYMCDDVMGLNTNVYRKKIKGFHLAFNVRDKLSEELS